jgi:hypothetical protein
MINQQQLFYILWHKDPVLDIFYAFSPYLWQTQIALVCFLLTFPSNSLSTAVTLHISVLMSWPHLKTQLIVRTTVTYFLNYAPGIGHWLSGVILLAPCPTRNPKPWE